MGNKPPTTTTTTTPAGDDTPKFLIGNLPLPTPEQLARTTAKGGRKFKVPGTDKSACYVIRLTAHRNPHMSAKGVWEYLRANGVKVALATCNKQVGLGRKYGPDLPGEDGD